MKLPTDFPGKRTLIESLFTYNIIRCADSSACILSSVFIQLQFSSKLPNWSAVKLSMTVTLVFHKVFRIPVLGKWKFTVEQFCSNTELLNWIWRKTSLLNDCSGSILHWLFYDVKFTHWLYISCVLTYALRDDITSSQDTDFNLKPRPSNYIPSHRRTKYPTFHKSFND